MPHFFENLFHHEHNSNPPPPQWTPAIEASYEDGKYSDATFEEHEAAELFCRNNAVEGPKLLPSELVDELGRGGCRLWRMLRPVSDRFQGYINHGDSEKGTGVTKVITNEACGDVCIFSNLPIMAGQYDIKGKQGIYYEVVIKKMGGIIAIGSACRPYPSWRFPGWNRLSAGLHLDDFRKFFEDPAGGKDYETRVLSQANISEGGSIGFGYEFASNSVFFTYNGKRLSNAFRGVYVPRENYDVYAAIGVEGDNDFEVNFGADPFEWKEANDWSWRIEGHVGNFAGPSGGEDLPPYQEAP